MKRFTILMLILILVSCLVLATDFKPRGPIDMQGRYEIKNLTNITSPQYCNATQCNTLTDFLTSSATDFTTNVTSLESFNDNATASTCPNGNYSFGQFANGTFKCRSDEQGAGGGGGDTLFSVVNNIITNTTTGGINISNGTLFANNVSADIESDRVKNPPTACPSKTAISSFGDNFSVSTCINAWFNDDGSKVFGGTMDLGNNSIINVTLITATNWSNVSINESQISNLAHTSPDNTSWNESLGFTLFLNRSSEDIYLSTFNESYDSLITDNTTWNESLGFTLFLNRTSEALYLSTFNITYNDLVTDNRTWNESLGFTLFLNRSSEGIYTGQDNRTWNESLGFTLFLNRSSEGLYTGQDNASWNVSEASTIFYSITNPRGYFENISNFTGTRNNQQMCRYDSANEEIDCDEPNRFAFGVTALKYCQVDITGSFLECDKPIPVDTNETVRMDNIAGFACGGTNKTSSFNASAGPVCTIDVDTWAANESKYYNRTRVDSLITNNISSHQSTFKHGNTTGEIQAVAVGGEVSGTIGSITLDNDALDDQYLRNGSNANFNIIEAVDWTNASEFINDSIDDRAVTTETDPIFNSARANMGFTNETNDWQENQVFMKNITVNDTIRFADGDHWISINSSEVFNGISGNTFWMHHSEAHAAGTIGFLISAENLTLFFLQLGLNNSAGFFGNSMLQMPNSLASNPFFNFNMSKLSNCLSWYDFYNVTPQIACDTEGYGASKIMQGGLHLWRELFIGGRPGFSSGISAIGTFNYQLKGNDANFNNGSVHVSTPVNFTSGFSIGDERILLTDAFEGSLGSFVNEPGNTLDWFVTSNPLCSDSQCAAAVGSGGSTIMNATYTSLDVNETNLTFVYSLVGLTGADDFTVTINNNSGSGDVELFTDSGTDTKVTQTITLGSEYWNASSITLSIDCDATTAARQCFIDTVFINGTSTADTTAEVDGFDSELCFSDGTRGTNGLCSRGIHYNASNDTISFQGTVLGLSGGGGGISGSGSTNNIMKWASSDSATNSNIVDTGTLITINSAVDFENDINLKKNDILNISSIFADDWRNVTINASQVGNVTHTADTNETTRMENIAGFSCSGSDKMSSFDASSNPACTADVDTWETNESKYYNRTRVDSLITTNISSHQSTFKHGNTTGEIQAVAVGGEVSGTIGNIILSNTALNDQYVRNGTNVNFLIINATDWSNVTIVQDQITDFSFIDTNETIRMDNLAGFACGGTNKTSSFNASAGPVCTIDVDTWAANESKYYNRTRVDSLITGNISSHQSTFKHGNTTGEIQAVAVGGEVSGTVGTITLDNDALDDQYVRNSTSVIFLKINATDWSNVTITQEQITDFTPITDTNETTRMDNIAGFSCSGSDKVNSFDASSNPACTTDVDTWAANESKYYNRTRVDSLITGNISSHQSTFKHGNTTAEIQGVAVGGEASGTIGTITLSNTALDDQYVRNFTAVNFLKINATDWSNVTIVQDQITDLSHPGNCSGSGSCGNVAYVTTSVTFATVDTGQGANELFDMDQNVQTDSDVLFASVNITNNLNMTGNNITDVQCIIYLSGGKSCSGS